MANVIRGRVYQLGNVEVIQTKGGTTFEKQELVLDAARYDGLTGEKGYDNYVTIEFAQKDIATLTGVKVGDVVEVSFQLFGTKYQNQQGEVKFITRIKGSKVEQLRKSTQQEDPVNVKPKSDLPF